MSTDDLMDARLRGAGERWRQATDAPGDAHDGPVVDITAATRRRRRRWPILASAAAVVALAAGITAFFVTRTDDHRAPMSGPPAATFGIVGHTWKVAWVVGPDGTRSRANGNATLRVDAKPGRLLAFDGCNTLHGSVDVDTHRLTIPIDLSRTMRACPPSPFVVTATTVDRMLARGTITWSVRNGVLVLTRRGVGRLVYAATSPDLRALPGTWRLTGVEHHTGSGETAQGSSYIGITITIPGGTSLGPLLVSHACYVNRADDIAMTRQTLTITGVKLDHAIPCPSTAGSNYDSVVDDVLRGTCTWGVEDGRLSITKGQVTLTFSR